MALLLLQNGTIVSNNELFVGSILVQDSQIIDIFKNGELPNIVADTIIDCTGKHIFPGVIDDQVHFREPGLTHKGSIATESLACLAGGVTTFMEMPNTNPQTTTIENLEQKFEIASQTSFANYSFYLGATNDNIDQLRALDKNLTCGVKVFMGSSTGNMLVDNPQTLQQIFSDVRIPIATHCEDETTIQANLAKYKLQYGDDIPVALHPVIRSAEACYASSKLASDLARKFGARLHILHLSSAKEMDLFESGPVSQKQITAEVCVHHLWFSAKDYAEKGAFIKWNPSIKEESDRIALFEALLEDKLDVIATDHAPHTLDEKIGIYTKSASGGPLVQHSLLAMLDMYHAGSISLQKIIAKMCHAPADLFGVLKRGYIAKGNYADLVIVNLAETTQVNKSNILYKCAWSPFEGHTFKSKIEKTILNGSIVYDNGIVSPIKHAMQISFAR